MEKHDVDVEKDENKNKKMKENKADGERTNV